VLASIARHALPFERGGDRWALTGHYRAEHLFVWSKRWRSTMCISRRSPPGDIRIESCSQELISIRGRKGDARQMVRITAAQGAGNRMDLTRRRQSAPFLAWKGSDPDPMAWAHISRSSSWSNAAMISPHGRARSTSPPGFVWPPSNKISGGKFLSSRTDGPEAALRRFCDWPP